MAGRAQSGALVVVGGHSRNIGKTSVMAGLIRALPEANWTAIKITQFGHGICSADGKPCECSRMDPDHPYALTLESDARRRSDSARFLAAGARRSYWLRSSPGNLGRAVPAIQEILRSSENAIIESNSILRFLLPDLYVVVLDFSVQDFKESSRRFLQFADALAVVEGRGPSPEWTDIAGEIWRAKPQFLVRPPGYASPELAGFVGGRLWNPSPPAGRARTTDTADPGPC
jgi:hypothetical protein